MISRASLGAAVVLLASAAPARADWILAAFVGGAATQAATLRIEQPASGSNFEARDVPFAGRSLDSPVYYGYRIMCARPSGLVQDPRVVLALRVAAGPTIPHGQSTIGGRTQEQYEWGRVAGQVAAGVECRVAPHLALIAEYKVTATRQRVAVPDGSASASFTTQHAIAGIAWRL